MNHNRIPSLRSGVKLGCAWILCLAILFSSFAVSTAQDNASITVSNPDLTAFPVISSSFWVFDEEGSFVKTLKSDSVKIQENNRVIVPDSLELQEPGTHFVVAVNQGPTLANRFAGVQRFDNIKKQIIAWAEDQPSQPVDDFSLVGNDGSVTSHLDTPSDWIKALNDYQPDLKASTIGLTSLTTALDVASDSGTGDSKTRAVLYITPLPEDAQLQGVQEAAKRAAELNIHLFVWLIGPQNYLSTDGALVLQKAAEDTHGQFFLYSGAETLPNLQEYLDPIHYVYKVSYTSEIKSSGNFDFALVVKQGTLSLTSETTKIKMEVSAPNPILLSPPIEVTRSWTEKDASNEMVLTPDSVKINAIIEFPDGHPRTLAYSRFFVDDKLVQENAAKPFDQFAWDISGITETGSHFIQVTVEDQLGLTGQTISIPVNIVVEPRPQNWLQKMFSWVTPLHAILIGGIILLLAIFAWFYLRLRKGNLAIRKVIRQKSTDPVTQPVNIEGDLLMPSAPEAEIMEWPQLKSGEPAPARLRPLNVSDLKPLPGDGIALFQAETTFGSDPEKVDQTVTGSSVSPVHAVIKRESLSGFRIFDAGSTTGTWVNYSPISSQGILLNHGDLIHLGRTAFRFEFLHAAPRKFQVLPWQEEK